MGKREISETVSRRFEERRQAAEAEATRRRRELQNGLPELRALDQKRTELSASLLDAALQGKEGLNERLSAIQKEQKELQERRAQILQRNGYPADYDVPKRRCAACEDTGFVDGKMCSCMKREIVLEGYRESGMGRLLERQRFDNFDLSRYDDKRLPDKDYSPREAMRGIFRDCLKWADNFTLSSQSLLLMGGTGLGKTHLTTAMAKAVIDKGYNVVYLTMPTVLSRAEKERFVRDDSEESVVRQMLDAELLILDDLGAEPPSNLASSLVYTVVNERSAVRGLPTIISTNMDKKHLEDAYGEAVTSRLVGEFYYLHFVGSDLRIN